MTTTELPYSEAAHIFVRETKAGYPTAAVYLPHAYDECGLCDDNVEHEHPSAKVVTEAELQAAILDYAHDQFCRMANC